MKTLVVERSHTNLAANYLGSNVVALEQTHAHLLEQELDLFSFLHRAVGLHLQLLEYTGRLVDVVLVLADRRQLSGETRSLVLHVDLALGDRAQRVDELQLDGHVRDLVHVRARLLHHFGHRLFELRASLRE